MMKKKQICFIFPLFIMGVFLVFTSSCAKDKGNNPISNNPTSGQTTAVFNPSVTYGTMTDQDGNVYKTVTIGNQTWMAENLRTTKYNDGTAILNITDDDKWRSLSKGAYCNYNNTSNNDTIVTFGRLYNRNAVNLNLAPIGWRVPTNADLAQLINYLRGNGVVGGNLKETGTTHWNIPNTGATNETGFTALPGGYRSSNGLFEGFGYSGYWWIAAEGYTNHALNMNFNSSNFSNNLSSGMGFSVRCLKE